MAYSLLGETRISEAMCFAFAAHGAIDQRRKYTNEPYITHPKAVASIVQSIKGHTWQQVAVAWLHDVVEDTAVELSTIEDLFGGEIALGVMHLTNVPKEAGNRAARFAMNLDKLSLAPAWVKTVKLADLYHNTHSIVQFDPKFAVLYLREKEQTLKVLRGGDQILFEIVSDQLARGLKTLAVQAVPA